METQKKGPMWQQWLCLCIFVIWYRDARAVKNSPNRREYHDLQFWKYLHLSSNARPVCNSSSVGSLLMMVAMWWTAASAAIFLAIDGVGPMPVNVLPCEKILLLHCRNFSRWESKLTSTLISTVVILNPSLEGGKVLLNTFPAPTISFSTWIGG